MTLDIAGSMTQGWLGYLIQQSLYNKLLERGLLVDKNDPAFQNPTKYIGPWYEEAEAKKISKELGWAVKPDPRGGWRRVVPSPDPIGPIEIEAIKKLVREAFIVIASS